MDTTIYQPADRDDTTAPTLAALLAARAEQIAGQQREQDRRAQLSREQDRREAVEYAQRWITASVSPELAAALRMLAACDDNRIDASDDYGDYNSPALAALILLDVSGAGVDTEARPSDHEEGRWRIQGYNYGASGLIWSVYGPNNYRAEIADNYTHGPLDALILDALTAYPAWLAGADARRIEEKRKQQAKPRRYVYVEGIHQDDEHPGVLTRGNRLCVRVQNPRAEDGLIEYTATLDNFSVGWLLITTESGAQRLIPVDRVQDITPLASGEADLADLDTDPDDAA